MFPRPGEDTFFFFQWERKYERVWKRSGLLNKPQTPPWVVNLFITFPKSSSSDLLVNFTIPHEVYCWVSETFRAFISITGLFLSLSHFPSPPPSLSSPSPFLSLSFSICLSLCPCSFFTSSKTKANSRFFSKLKVSRLMKKANLKTLWSGQLELWISELSKN